MEFLNGLKAQPLELLVGEVCQQVRRLFIVQSVVRVWVFPPSLSSLKANFLGKMPKTLACGSVFHILLCMCGHGVEFSKRIFFFFFNQEVVCWGQSEMWLMLNHFIGREGKCPIDH